MSRWDRRYVVVLALLMAITGAGRWLGSRFLAGRESGPGWESPEEIPAAPYPGRVLFLFEADWCPECVVLKETVLAKPSFSRFLEEEHLTLIRIAEERLGRFDFLRGLEEYEVDGIPAMIAADSNGQRSVPIVGALPEAVLEDEIRWRLDWLDKSIHWRDWNSSRHVRADRPALLLFDDPRSIPGVSAWWRKWRPDVAGALNSCFDLFSADKGSPPNRARLYRAWDIIETPTVVVLDSDNREVGRYAGVRSVAEAAAKLTSRDLGSCSLSQEEDSSTPD